MPTLGLLRNLLQELIYTDSASWSLLQQTVSGMLITHQLEPITTNILWKVTAGPYCQKWVSGCQLHISFTAQSRLLGANYTSALLPKVGFRDANYTSALLPKVGFWDANYTSAWANHNKHTVKSARWSWLFLGIKRLGGYSSSFSHTVVIVMLWLAEVLGDWQPQTACNADNMTSRQCSGKMSTCVWV